MNSVKDTCLTTGGFSHSEISGYNACLPAPPSLSQATTSFIASDCLGIHRMRLVAWPYNTNDLWQMTCCFLLKAGNNSDTHQFCHPTSQTTKVFWPHWNPTKNFCAFDLHRFCVLERHTRLVCIYSKSKIYAAIYIFTYNRFHIFKEQLISKSVKKLLLKNFFTDHENFR